MPSDKKTSINVRAFIDHFGGAQKMREAWERQGLALTKGAQEKWVMRGAVPTSRILEAVQVSRYKRKAFNFASFVTTTREAKK